MPFELSPLPLSSLSESITLAALGFANDPILKHFYSQLPHSFHLKRNSNRFHDPGVRYFQVIDTETGRMAGWTRWLYPHPSEGSDLSSAASMPDWPEGVDVNVPMWDDYFGQLDRGREKNCDSETMFFVNVLVVHPDYQGRGLGRMLMERGLQDADAAGAKTYIEATEVGVGLYKKLGFVAFDKIRLDLEKYGVGEGEGVDHLMIREADGKV